MGKDIRDAIRWLRASPASTGLIVSLYALGVALSVTVFAVFKAVLLDPLPFREPERLVQVWGRVERFGFDRYPLSFPNFLDYRKQTRTLASLSAFRPSWFTLDGEGPPTMVSGARVSPDLLDLLGVEPALGRGFTVDETSTTLGAAAEPNLALVSHHLWRQQLGARPDALGASIQLDGQPFTVIGVLPERFRFPDPDSQVLVPLVAGAIEQERTFNFLDLVGRIAGGVTVQQAESELQGIARNLAQAYPDANEGLDLRLVPLREEMVGSSRSSLQGLFLAVQLLLVVACLNVSSLLVAQGAARQRQLGIRLALGAGRLHLARLVLIENLLAAGLGGVLGLGLCIALLGWIRELGPALLPRSIEVGLDSGTLLYAGGLVVLCGALFGVLPIPVALARGVAFAREGRSSPSRGTRRALAALVAAQAAFALVLLFGGSVLARSLTALGQVRPGFNPDQALVAGVALPTTQFPTTIDQDRFIRRALADLAQLPGVEAVGAVSRLPFAPGTSSATISRPEQAGAPDNPSANFRVVTPDLFESLGVPLLEGRDFTPADDAGHHRVAIVDQAAARILWPGRSPLGEPLRLGGGDAVWEVVGVVANVRWVGLDKEIAPTVYVPVQHSHMHPAMRRPQFVVRTSRPLRDLRGPLREVLQAVDPSQALLEVRPLSSVLDGWLAERRRVCGIVTGLALATLFLAAAGLYALVAFAVAQRRTDLAIRSALGAGAATLRWSVVVAALRPVAAGTVLGLLGCWLVGVRVAPYLFQVPGADLVSMAAAVGGLLLAGIGAGLLAVRGGAFATPAAALGRGS